MPLLGWYLFLLLSSLSFASWSIPSNVLLQQNEVTRQVQLHEFLLSSHPVYDSYLGASWLFLPNSRTTMLSTPWGEHQGYAFQQKLALLLQNRIENSDQKIGLAWWVERHGFQNEDFLLFPPYSDFGYVSSVQTFSAFYGDLKRQWGMGLGGQWLHDEYRGMSLGNPEDHLYWFSQFHWSRMSSQMVMDAAQWKELRVHFSLADKGILGQDTVGWKTYLPDLDASITKEDSIGFSLGLKQNLWDQRLYAVLQKSWIINPLWGFELVGYAEKSHFIGMGLGAYSENKEMSWGGWFEVPFLRIGYNDLKSHRDLFHAQGTWVIQIHLSLGAIAQESLFHLDAPCKAAMESQVLEERNRPVRDASWKPEGSLKEEKEE